MKDSVTKKRVIVSVSLVVAVLIVLMAPMPKNAGEGTLGFFFASNIFYIILSLFSLSFLVALALAVLHRVRDVRVTEKKVENKVDGDVKEEAKPEPPVTRTVVQTSTPNRGPHTPSIVIKVLLVSMIVVFVVISGLGEVFVNTIETKLYEAPMPKIETIAGAYPGWLWFTIMVGVLWGMLRGYPHASLILFFAVLAIAFIV